MIVGSRAKKLPAATSPCVLTAIAFTSKLGGIKVPRPGAALVPGMLQRTAREGMINRDERYIEDLNTFRPSRYISWVINDASTKFAHRNLPASFRSAPLAGLG